MLPLLLLRPKLFLLTILAGWQTDFVATVESTYSHGQAVKPKVYVLHAREGCLDKTDWDLQWKTALTRLLLKNVDLFGVEYSQLMSERLAMTYHH